MTGVLVVAEQLDGRLREVTLELVSAGRELKSGAGGSLAVAVLAAEPERLAAELALAGVDEVVAVPVGEDAFSGDAYRAALAALLRARAPAVVLAGFTVTAMGWAPALAATLGLGFASDVVACGHEGGRLVARREFYGAKVQGELEFPGHEQVLLMLRPTVWPPAPAGGAPALATFDPGPLASRTRHLEYVAPPAGDVDITAADVVLAVGRGVGERDNLPQLEELAGKLGATLAASRPLVDAGWVAAERQVGQSGRTVKPRLYLALGISGAVQHLAGMKGAATIVAVNTDPDAAIFNVAHYGAVADLFDVAEELDRLA